MKPKVTLPLIILLLVACQSDSKRDDSPTESNVPVVISEVMAGNPGNNNYEFIELYNSSERVADLNGLSLWYRLPTSEEDMLVYKWVSESLVPGRGHYLLSRVGEDIGILSNATFTQAMNTNAGGLLLRDSEDQVVDSLGWGNAPEAFTENSPAPAIENGKSLERNPGGSDGNQQDSNDNSEDFSLSSVPTPQNTGSTPTPSEGQSVSLSISGPASIEPGSEFEYLLNLANLSSDDLTDITVEMLLPVELLTVDLPGAFEQDEQKLYWQIDNLPSGSEISEFPSTVCRIGGRSA